MKMKKGFGFIVLVIIIAGMMTAFVTVQGYSTFQGTVEDGRGNPLSGATVILADCYSYILDWDTTDSEGDYSFSVTLNGNSPYKLSATKAGFITEVKENIYSGGTYDFVLGEKIAVFFYAYDACNDNTYNSYKEILEDEHFTKFFKFANSDDVESDCETVDDYESDVDTIFVYVMGHGEYDGESYTYFKSVEQSKVYSSDFKDYLDLWDAERICLLVESCYSGSWAYHFAYSPYLAISTTDTSHEAEFRPGYPNQEGLFSYHFFDWVDAGYTAVESYNHAKGECEEEQDPQIRDYSTYVWFD